MSIRLKQALQKVRVLPLIAVTGSFAGTHAIAQESDRTFTGIDEIVITAQKRSESLQDVPISITAITSETAQKTFLKDLNDVADYTPGLNVENNPGFRGGSYRIRGIGSNFLTIDGSSAVSSFIDDVYLGRPGAGNQPMVDMERVEVVKGPQGTLFGRNTIGGAISLVTKKPVEDYEGFIRGTFEDYGRIRVETAFNAPVIEDKLFMRIAGQITDDPGHYKNLTTGENIGGDSHKSVRLSFKALPSDNLEILLIGDLQHVGTEGPALKSRLPLPGNVALNPYGPVAIDAPQAFTTNGRGITLRVNYDLETIAFSSITNWRNDDADILSEVDGTTLNMFNQHFLQDFEQYSQELRLTSQIDDPLSWVLGASYYKENSYEAGNAIFGGDLLRIVGVDVPSELTSTQLRVNDQKIESYAVFGEAKYQLTSEINLTAGLRYTSDNLRQTVNTNSIGFPFSLLFGPGVFGPTTGPVMREKNFSGLTPRFVVDYSPTEDLMIFASVTNGYKMGGFDPSLPNEVAYKPERVWNYEAGFKSSWLDRRLSLNMTAYYYKYSNLLSRNNVNGVLLLLDSKVKGKGLEGEIVYTPIEGLFFGTSFSVQDPEYADFIENDVQLAGYQVVGSSKFSSSSYLEYEFPISDDINITIRGEYTYTGKSYTQSNNNTDYTINDVGLANIRIGLTDIEQKYSLSFFGRNIFSEKYLTTNEIIIPGLVESWTSGSPSSWGIELSMNF